MGSKKYSWPKEDKYVEDCLLIDLNFPKVSLSLSLSLCREWPYQSAGHPVHHDALWQIHGVSNGQDHKAGLLVSGPVKEIVHYVLFLGPQKVKLPGNGERHRVNHRE